MKTTRGFTVLELLLALLLVSLVAAVAIPAFFRAPTVTLENASSLLAQDLRAACNRSAYLAEPCLFRFPPDGDGYLVTDLSGRVVRHPATGEDFAREWSADGVFRGVVIHAVQAGGDRTVEVDAYGRPGEPARITLGFQGETRTVTLEASSGRVAILGSTRPWRE